MVLGGPLLPVCLDGLEKIEALKCCGGTSGRNVLLCQQWFTTHKQTGTNHDSYSPASPNHKTNRCTCSRMHRTTNPLHSQPALS